jgi:hypothetical protein
MRLTVPEGIHLITHALLEFQQRMSHSCWPNGPE